MPGTLRRRRSSPCLVNAANKPHIVGIKLPHAGTTSARRSGVRLLWARRRSAMRRQIASRKNHSDRPVDFVQLTSSDLDRPTTSESSWPPLCAACFDESAVLDTGMPVLERKLQPKIAGCAAAGPTGRFTSRGLHRWGVIPRRYGRHLSRVLLSKFTPLQGRIRGTLPKRQGTCDGRHRSRSDPVGTRRLALRGSSPLTQSLRQPTLHRTAAQIPQFPIRS